MPCSFFHPHQTCWQHPLQLLLPAYSRALSVYIPVYLLPALLVHRQELLKRPVPILQKVLQGIARWVDVHVVAGALPVCLGEPPGTYSGHFQGCLERVRAHKPTYRSRRIKTEESSGMCAC